MTNRGKKKKKKRKTQQNFFRPPQDGDQEAPNFGSTIKQSEDGDLDNIFLQPPKPKKLRPKTGSKKRKQVVINQEVSEVLPQNSTSRIDKTEKTENLIIQSLNDNETPEKEIQ